MIGHGLEIIATAQIEILISQRDGFELEYFTIAECNGAKNSPDRVQYLGSRLAAKKAVIRILAIKDNPDLLWHDIEIQRMPSGKPFIVLWGRCQDRAIERGITQWLLSISHTASYAAASAIAL